MKIEMYKCNTCHKTNESQTLPLFWIQHSINLGLDPLSKLFPTNIETHFCSKECFVTYIKPWLGIEGGTPQLDQKDAPQTKMRRFVIVNRDRGTKREGVLWDDGSITLEPDEERGFAASTFASLSMIYIGPDHDIQWLDEKPQAPTQQDKPQTKMRRFRLFPEWGDDKQGVECRDGCILIDEHDPA